MNFRSTKGHRPLPILHSTELAESIAHLERVASGLHEDGYVVESESLRTTVDDLRWQYEKLLETELLAEWPNGPRRATRAIVRAAS